MPSDLIFLLGNARTHHRVATDKHYDGYYSLKLITRGSIDLYYDAKHYTLATPHFFTGYPGPRTRFHLAVGCEHWEHRYLVFKGPLVERWKTARLWFEAPQTALPDKDYAARFDAVLLEAKRHDPFSTLRGANLLESILIDLAEARAEVQIGEPWLERVLDALGQDRPFAPDYGHLAAACNMGLSTLRRRFKEAMGVSLHAYVLQNRLRSAQDLLVRSELSIGEIAERLGYRDVYFFSTQFRKHIGLAPSVYRQHLHER